MNDRRQEVIDADAEFEDAIDPAGAVPVPAIQSAMIPASSAIDLVELEKQMGARVDATLKIRRHVVRLTHPTDWVLHEGKGDGGAQSAYLQEKGALRVAATLGIGWHYTDADVRRENLVGSDGRAFYQYTVSGTVSWQNREIPARGGASSRHPFLTKGGRIPSEDVPEIHVKKKAITDFIRTGICDLLGFKDVPLTEFPPEYQKAMGCVSYQKGTQGGDTSTDEDKDRRAEIVRLCMMMASGDQAKAQDLLELHTTFTGKDGKPVRGIRDSKALQGKRLEVTLGKVRRAAEEWQDAPTAGGKS